jgi:hypothetical protein
VRVLIIGSSSSAGTGLPDRSLAWPWLVQQDLGAQLGEPVELVHQVIFPVGSRAVPMAMAALEDADPDVVIHSFGFFSASVTTVSERVRRRYGPRATRLYRRVVERHEAKTGHDQGGRPARRNRAGRWLARKVIGADAIATFDEVMGNLTGVQHGLAQREGLVVISMCEPALSGILSRDHPKAHAIFERGRVEMAQVARSHHFVVGDCASGYDRHPHRDSLFLSDGLHKNAEGQRIQADAVLAALRSAGVVPAAAMERQA